MKGLNRELFVAACLVWYFIAAGSVTVAAGARAEDGSRWLTRTELIEDTRELSGYLETAHPDPYASGGGKIAYHRRLQSLIREFPEEGLSEDEFCFRLQSLIAALADGHTTLSCQEESADYGEPGGVPLFFEVVDERLFVAAVVESARLPLTGAVLEAVEGVRFETLVERELAKRGHDNRHHALSSLARDGVLYFGESLRRLVPEWTDRNSITVTLRLPSGEVRHFVLEPASGVEYPLHRKSTRLELPDTDRSFAYHFIDAERSVALLRIDNMTTYRELFEYSRAIGSDGWEDWARRVYERVNPEPSPDDPDALIGGIPSATETFRDLFREMRSANTETLIVDLRRNFGGNDLMIPMFLYFLEGLEVTVSVTAETTAVQKLSPLFLDSSEAGFDVASIPYADEVPIGPSDYDFSHDSSVLSAEELGSSLTIRYSEMFLQAPTFARVFRERQDEALFRPDRILVLSSNRTQSSGFDLLTMLYRLGAEIVGVESSQAGNHFGNVRSFALQNSKLTGYVSTKYFVAYPGESSAGFTLEPDHLMTYDRLASYGFDKNATVLFALELLGLEGVPATGRK